MESLIIKSILVVGIATMIGGYLLMRKAYNSAITFYSPPAKFLRDCVYYFGGFVILITGFCGILFSIINW